MDYKKQEITDHFDEWLEESLKHEGYEWIKDNLDDLHSHCFNTDYYIIGTHQATEWMGDKVFEIINFVKEYEQDNFGECATDLTSPEKIVNMYVYIIGEEIAGEYVQQQEAA